MKRVSTLIALAALAAISMTDRIEAQSYPFNPIIGGVPVQCSSGGQPVAFIPNPILQDIGRAQPGFPPTIELNPMFLGQLPPALQLFWYGHECAHHVLDHASVFSFENESEADCWSIQTGRDQGLFDEADVVSFEPYFKNNPGSPWGHLPGPARMQKFLDCYDEGSDNHDTGSVCEYTNDGECDEPGLCPIGTDSADCATTDEEEWPRYCCTPAGKLGPYPNDNLYEGDACFGTHPVFGQALGQACY